MAKTQPQPVDTERAAPQPEAALTLSTTEFDRRPVKIDGVAYLMRSPEELSTQMMGNLFAVQSRIEALQGQMTEEVTEDEMRGLLIQVDKEIEYGVSLVMFDPIPKEKFAELTFRQQTLIIATFKELASDDKPAS